MIEARELAADAAIRVTAVVHVITGLQVGGAELALYRLLTAADPARVTPSVVSLTPGGDVADRIAALGVPVTNLGMRSARDYPSAVARLTRQLRDQHADVVQTWMHHADLVGGVAGRLAGVPVVWGLRAGPIVAEPRTTRAIASVNGRLAGVLPTAIVACSQSVAGTFTSRSGHAALRTTVIPNGYDIKGPDVRAGLELRERLGIPADAVVIGRVGRWHPMKGYGDLLAAARGLLGNHPYLHVLLVGDGVEATNPELAAMLSGGAASGRIHVLGPRRDVLAVYSAMDIFCSSSSSAEGFPNVIAEAMLAEVPVVATDVGESATIVGDAGRVVPPSRPDLLAVALADLVDMPASRRRALGRRGHEIVQQRYGLARMANAYADLHQNVARRGPAQRALWTRG